MNPANTGARRVGPIAVETSRARYRRTFASARAMRFWHTRLCELVVCGAAALPATALAQFPAVFDLGTLDGTNGFVLNGVDAGDDSGRSVSSAGDVNGDGIDDLIIGAGGAYSSAGGSYVVFGRDTSVGAAGFGGTLDLGTLEGTMGFVLTGVDAGDLSGSSVSSAGDLNGDGFDDLIIGARSADPEGKRNAGESYVVFGRDTSVGGAGFGATLDLGTLNGANGFVLTGVDAGDKSGGSVSRAGDVNGDGVADLIIGAFSADPSEKSSAGESYVVFGRDTSVGASGFGGTLDLGTLEGTMGFVLTGVDAGDLSGSSVSSAGDLNGDGFDDLIIGARSADPEGKRNAGESYVVFGRDTSVGGAGFGAELDLGTLDGTHGFVLTGVDDRDYSGSSVSSAGDVNGDGVDDLIIGAHEADTGGNFGAGESYVVFGRDMSAGEASFSASLDLGTLNGDNGFVLTGVDAGDFSGYSVSSAGDVNGDGVDDLIIGAVAADSSESLSAGESYVVFGRNMSAGGVGFGDTLDLSMLNGANGFVLAGVDAGDLSGLSVSSAGDVNGDGVDDLIVGAPRADPGGNSNAGETYVVFGRRAVVPPGDFNSDGIVNGSDFLAWQRNPNLGNLADWKANFGQTIDGLSASRAVPEPSSGLLAAGALVAGFGTRRRNQ